MQIEEKKVELTAKFSGTCFACGQKIALYADIYWFPNRRERKTCHKQCPVAPTIEQVLKKEEKVEKGAKLPDGYFTVLFDFCGERTSRTLRVKTQPKDASFAPGKQIIALLTGRDNENDYTGFAFVSENGFLSVWKSKATMQAAIIAANVLLDGSYKEAARAYVLESGRCCRCNRLLTVQKSIEQSMGPVCAAKMGL